jgi:hypothetical protein
MDIDDESGANGLPVDLDLEDDEFSEDAEYEGETDDEGDFSEPHDDAGSDWRGEGAASGGARLEPDIEIEVSRNAKGQWTAEVFVPAMVNLQRYATHQWSQDLVELEGQVRLLQRIGEAFVDMMQGQWDAYFESRTLDSAGRLFRAFRQERLAKAFEQDESVISRCRDTYSVRRGQTEKRPPLSSVISRCRDTYSVRLPKFGVVPLGTLFDAAVRGDLELAEELARNYLKKNQAKLVSCRKGAMRSMRAELVEMIAKTLVVTPRQGRTYVAQLEQEGLLSWPKA